MHLEVHKDEQNWNEFATHWLQREAKLRQSNRVFLPAGNTPLGIYKEWTSRPAEFLRTLRFSQVDDILTGPKAGLFARFFNESLPHHNHQFSPLGTCEFVGDIAILGIGTNGHVAFHEPGISNEMYSGCLKLASETCHNLQLDPGTWGITYGLKAFLNCKSILVLVKGEQKRKILTECLNTSSELPAAQILRQTHCTLVTDFNL